MSRRKQARPKACKSDEQGDIDEVTAITEETQEDASLIDSMVEFASKDRASSDAQKKETAENTEVLPERRSEAPLDSRWPKSVDEVSANNASDAKIMRCESCCAVFDSLDQFMDHRNFECGGASATKNNWLLSETNSNRSASPSSQSTSSVDANGNGIVEADCLDLEGLDPSQVPFVIGITDANPFNCQFCEKAFSNKAYRKVHEQTHTAHMPYKCHHCPRLFRHNKSRERHEKLHSSDRKYKCGTCGVGYSRSDHLRNHMKSHERMENDEGYKCPVCQQNYMSASALTNHLKTHKNKYAPTEILPGFSCPDCSNMFSSTEELQQHILTHTDSTPIKVEKFDCDVCQEVFYTQEHLDTHTDEVHSQDLDFKCPICFTAFADKDHLCQHIVSHNFTELHNEGLENSTSELIQSLIKEKRGIKENEGTSTAVTEPEMLICPYCLSEGFKTLESLELHLTSVHSVKPTEVYTCNYCNAPYPNLYSLHDHMTVVHRSQHGLDITYPCSMCVQRFHSLDALAKHKGIVHAQQRSSGIDAAFCNRCNMTLASPRSLEDHMATVHNIIMDKSPKLSKNKGKKLPGKPTKDRDYLQSSASGQGTKTPTSQDTKLTSPSVPMSPMQCLTPEMQAPSKSTKISALLARKTASDNFYTDQSLSNGSSGMIPNSLTCDHCNATFHDAQNFAAHMTMHTGSLVNLSLSRGTQLKKTAALDAVDSDTGNGSNNRNQSSSTKPHECFKCGASFTTEEQLEAHASLHYLCVSTEYGCSSCSKNFSKPDELQKHLMDIHAHHLYRCSLCKDIFDSKVNIQVHFAIKHSNECKLYKCLSCDIMFRSEMEWQVHVRVNHLHMSRPYRCLFCQESFTSEVELQCHLTTHSKQFTCPMCDQAFHIEYLLDQHMQSCHGDAKPDLGQRTPTGGHKSPHSSSPSPFKNITIKQEKEEISAPYYPPPSSSMSSSSSSSCSPRIILKSPTAPSPHKQSRIVSPQTPLLSLSPLPTSTSVSMASTASAIWKSTEPLHMCSICDMKFCDLALLNNHKAQDHGLKAATKSSPMDVDITVKSEHEKLLLNNQTLLSALTSPASPVSSSQQHAVPHQSHLSCMFCSQTFKTSIEYNKHMKIHVNSGNLTCSICDETFTSASVLAEHKLTHCKIQQGNTCVVCRVTMSNQEQFYMHAQEHGFEGSVLQCVVCRQTLSSVVELQMHGRHHFQTRPAFFTCCVCLKSFESKENLVSKLNSTGRTYYVCKPCYHGEAPLHTCSQCSEKFATSQLLEAHMQTHKASFQCIKCQQSFSSEYEIQLHVTSHMLTEGTQHECRLCGAFFDSPARLQTHLIQHSFVGKDIVCFVCNKIFESPQEIQVHALEHGAPYRKYGCSHCLQKFFFTAELDNHKLIYNHGTVSSANSSSLTSSTSSLFSSPAALSMATLASFLSTSPLIKSPEAPSSLAFANKKILDGFSVPGIQSAYDPSFNRGMPPAASKIQDTLTVPTVPSSYSSSSSSSSSTPHGLQCPECLKYFSTGTALANHRKTHWKKDANNAIRCSLCSQTFNSATAMQQHFFSLHSDKQDEQKKKKSFKCMMCEKECSTLSALQNHILSHRTGSSLPCLQCKKTFTSQRYLNLHMRVHKPVDKKMDKGVNQSNEEKHDADQREKTDEKKASANLCCPVCGQSFDSTEAIDNHIKTHEEVFTTLGSVSDCMDFTPSNHNEEDHADNAMEIEDR